LKCKERRASRERNKLLKKEREREVFGILCDIDATYIMASRTFKELCLYTDKGKGNLDTIRKKASEKKRIHDQRTPMHAVVSKRHWIVHELVCDIVVDDDDEDLYQEICEQNEVVIRHIFEGIGDEEIVTQACLEEIDRFRTRRSLSAQERTQRRQALSAELHLHGVTLCNNDGYQLFDKYVIGETNASFKGIVSMIKLTSFLHGYNLCTWFYWYYYMKFDMANRVRKGECGNWYEAYDRVVQDYADRIQIDDWL
jgi:hypothetical protein